MAIFLTELFNTQQISCKTSKQPSPQLLSTSIKIDLANL